MSRGIIRDLVLLSAKDTVERALEKVNEREFEVPVVVRRQWGTTVLWYAYTVGELIDRIQTESPDAPLINALYLHEHDAAPAPRLPEIEGAIVDRPTVILEGNRLMGVAMPGAEIPAHPDVDFTRPERMAGGGPPPPKPVAPQPAPPRSAPSQPATEAPSRGGGLLDFLPDIGNIIRSVPFPGLGRRRRRSGGSQSSASEPPRRGHIEPLPDAPDRVEELDDQLDEMFDFEPETGDDPGGAPQPEPAPAPGSPPPFTAFPFLRAPRQLKPQQNFTLTIGLARKQDPQTGGGAVSLDLPAHVDEFPLEVHVMADGFDAPLGLVHELRVNRADPERNRLEIPLVAPDAMDEPLPSVIAVTYVYRSMPCGLATWGVFIVPEDAELNEDRREFGREWREGEDDDLPPIRIDPSIPGIDLTVLIAKLDGDETTGRFNWQFHTPHDVAKRAGGAHDIGNDAVGFASKVIRGVEKSDKTPLLGLELAGLGLDVFNALHPEFYPLLKDIWQAVRVQDPRRIPTVLFATAESHVPWELAYLEDPLDPDPDVPSYLGAQVAMSRWVVGAGAPPIPPPHAVHVQNMAVVVGDYAARTGLRKLEFAEEEGKHLHNCYGALKVEASPADMSSLLCAQLAGNGQNGGAEAVHFACHGEVDSLHQLEGAILLDEGLQLTPEMLARTRLGREFAPFLFLNACQVGTASDMLGSFGGFAGKSIQGGFRGFLAPLWSVDDERAHELAVEFYEKAFGDAVNPPQSVSSILCQLKRRFEPAQGASWLAYVFYGHPELLLTRGS